MSKKEENIIETLKVTFRINREENMTETSKVIIWSNKEENMTDTLKYNVWNDEKNEAVMIETLKETVRNDKDEAIIKKPRIKARAKAWVTLQLNKEGSNAVFPKGHG